MDAVGHEADGHVLLGILGPDLGPHPARDLAVQAADPVVEAGQAQGQDRHAEMLGVVARVLPPQCQEDLPGQAEIRGVLLEISGHELRRKTVVAGGDRGMRGEDGTLGDHFQGRLEGQPLVGHEGADALQPREGRMPLVHVDDPRRQPHGAEGLDAADAEQVLLHEPHLQVAPVELRSQVPAFGGILRDVRVHEEQRHASDIHPPDAEEQGLALHEDADLERVAVVVQHREEGHLLEVVGMVAFLLPAVMGQVLAEVAALVAEPDAHQRDVQVAGRLEVVAGQDAQAAGIDGQTLGQSVFGAEVGHDGAFLRGVEPGHGAALGYVFLKARRDG